MPDEEYSLFESVVQITEERDKRSLERALVETLADFIACDAIVLLRVPHFASIDVLEVAIATPAAAVQQFLQTVPYDYGDQRVLPDDSVALCIRNGAIMSEQHQGVHRMLFPVVVNKVVAGVLGIYGHQSNIYSEKLIRGFVRIFSNFQAIINEKDHDSLTGLLNRKTFDERLAELLAISLPEENHLPLADGERRALNQTAHQWVGLLDIDHFKRINDSFGHVMGDEVLLLFTGLMQRSFRNSDLLFRFGGEEFVVVLRPTPDADAYKVFERFRANLAAFNFPQVGQISVSIGFVKICKQGVPAAVVEQADAALYYAKNQGRNQVHNYHDLIQSGALSMRPVASDIELF